jgi:hypothetical protein
MKIKCEFLTNKNNGGNCKVGPKNQKTGLYEKCVFKNNDLRKRPKLSREKKAEISCLSTSECRRRLLREHRENYFVIKIAPQVQSAIHLEDEKIEKGKKTKKSSLKM